MFTFLHTSDFHLGAPFGFLPPRAAEMLRQAQQSALAQIENIIRQNNVDFLFICGDVFDSQNPSLKEILLFRSWTEKIARLGVSIFIIPGNHDAYAEGNFWDKENFSATVFRGKDFQRIEIKERDLTIFGFPCRRENSSKRILADLGSKLFSTTKYSVLLFHGAWENFGKELESDYPFSTSELQKIKVDYVALGNYHNYLAVSESPLAFFAGSPTVLDFSDTGRKPCVILGRCDQKIQTKQVSLASPIFKSEVLDLATISTGEFLQKIHLSANPNLFWQLKLVGIATPEILAAVEEAKTLAPKFAYLEIDEKNLVVPETIPRDETYLGKYCQELTQLLASAQTEEEKRIINKAIQLGLAFFES